MAHIYIHVPFCRQACYYCNFHFLVSKKHQRNFVEAIKNEIEITTDYLNLNKDQEIETVYFGGGTPSFLPTAYILEIFDELGKYYSIKKDTEVTLEANPDDLTKQKLLELKNSPINRLSIGIQSFHEKDLKYLNRSHNAEVGIASIKNAQNVGFNNINLDLIFGIPTSTDMDWELNLKHFAKLNIQHLSAYSLTIEPKTSLEFFIRKQKAKPIDENQAARQFLMLMEFAQANDLEHYEISNYSKAGKYSKHNISYWQNKAYLGLGPAAHSFNLNSRQWNISNTTQYIKSLLNKEMDYEKETLTREQQYNEFVFTNLRTMWGIDSTKIMEKFGEPFAEYFLAHIKKYKRIDQVQQKGSIFTLTTKGKLYSDAVASDCFYL